MAAFTAQVGHESGRFRYARELSGDEYLSKYDTGPLAKRLGNTPEADGDGQKYLGRGLIQVTDRDNYYVCSKALFGDDRLGAENESAARAREQSYQQSINKVVQDGQRTIDQFTAERASRNGVPLYSQPVRPAAIPVLPPQARQLPVSSWCLPRCSSALMKERSIWQDMLRTAMPEE